MFDPVLTLGLGLATGFVFGFLLQKGQVSKYRTIVGQFLLRDFTMLKVMLTAVVVGGVGVFAMAALGLTALHVKPLILGGVVVGGLIFGVGMAVSGYCPGTGVAAAAEGSRHAIMAVLGMFTGAAVYAEIYPAIHGTLLAWGDYGKLTFPDLTGWPAGALLAVLAAVVVGGFLSIEYWQRRRTRRTIPDSAAGSPKNLPGGAA